MYRVEEVEPNCLKQLNGSGSKPNQFIQYIERLPKKLLYQFICGHSSATGTIFDIGIHRVHSFTRWIAHFPSISSSLSCINFNATKLNRQKPCEQFTVREAYPPLVHLPHCWGLSRRSSLPMIQICSLELLYNVRNQRYPTGL